MLDKDPAKRPSASEVLRNEYIAQNLVVRNNLDNTLFTLSRFVSSFLDLTSCGLSLLLVLFLGLRGFSPGTPVFSSLQKPTFPNSNLIWNCQVLYHEPLPWVIAQALPVFDIKIAFFQ